MFYRNCCCKLWFLKERHKIRNFKPLKVIQIYISVIIKLFTLNSCSTRTYASRRQGVTFSRQFFSMWMSDYYTETLNPFFRIFPIFRFQDQSLILCENFECFRDISGTSWHFYRSYLIDVNWFSSTLKFKLILNLLIHFIGTVYFCDEVKYISWLWRTNKKFEQR